MTSPGDGTPYPVRHGEVLSAISDGMVGLPKEFYGRGPTQAKSYYQDDLVACVLRGGFTRVEQTLLDGGRGTAVIQQRMAFQELMRDRFIAVIEHATGRQVIGFMSGNQQDPDLMCEVFVLAPTELFDDVSGVRTHAGPEHRGLGGARPVGHPDERPAGDGGVDHARRTPRLAGRAPRPR